MDAFSAKIWVFIYTLILLVLTGCAGIRPSTDSEGKNVDAGENIETLKSIIQEQGEKINSIEQDLVIYQKMINDRSQVLEIYDDNNQSVKESKLEKEMTNTLIKMQNKIHILEDRTFYTDSLYFEIINDLVMIENQIESLISSYKEMNEISVKKKTIVIPKITNEEYEAKYIKSLAHYQNGEWNASLDGFKYLLQADSNHDKADNCQYWIGEVYFALKDYPRSIKEFEKVFTFPGTNKADDAQLKLGLCYVNIGKIDKAKQEFENLLEFYPNSEYYKRSQEYLQKY